PLRHSKSTPVSRQPSETNRRWLRPERWQYRGWRFENFWVETPRLALGMKPVILSRQFIARTRRMLPNGSTIPGIEVFAWSAEHRLGRMAKECANPPRLAQGAASGRM